ncbi:MAG: D-alanyl-D-alanine carboxypeptidase [Erysipelotrichia bacterium]|nr:D-alanyl-D-alanine carboxypeptidase [Erysipelotrichia bacterium]NCC55272.1 D-alanyl-D-alanine carboxypeptidase [Erysipelotrichia bacterium]
MKSKRVILIAILTFFSMTCIYMMSVSYDRLARYQYKIDNEQREVIESHLSDDDINYIIQQKIKPEQFMDFILLDGFSVKNTLYYEVCRMIRPIDLQSIVYFVNTYKEQMKFTDLEDLITNYDYQTLSDFYDGKYTYIKDASLLSNPSDLDTKIERNETIYKYVPNNLVMMDNSIVPTASILGNEYVEVKSELFEPIKNLCNDIATTNEKTCGGLILTSGYVSYENQIAQYEQAILKYGVDNFHKYDDFPGQSEKQLGYTVVFTVSEIAEDAMAESAQAKWLLENAKKYGFIVRYPKEQESKTGKVYQPFTLRYVGVDALKEENNIFDTIFTGN